MITVALTIMGVRDRQIYRPERRYTHVQTRPLVFFKKGMPHEAMCFHGSSTSLGSENAW